MIVTAHQPAYLPWLGLLSKINAADVCVFLDDVPLTGRGGAKNGNFENRQRIKTQNGPQWLTVPVQRHDEQQIKNVRIANDQPWRRKHWRAIELAYHDALFFNEYRGSLQKILEYRYELLVDLNWTLLHWHLVHFGIKTRVVKQSYEKVDGTKSDLVLNIARHFGATKFIFGANGHDYANVESFREAKIDVEFQNYEHPAYIQLHGEFVSHLAALDALLNLGPEVRRLL